MPWIKLAKTTDLPPGSLMEIARGDDLYAVCNVDGEIRALSGVCPHQGGPLGEGALNGNLGHRRLRVLRRPGDSHLSGAHRRRRDPGGYSACLSCPR
jgi:hypothetical protein